MPCDVSALGFPSKLKGIVTRCPLELRLKKVNSGVKWKAVISYKKKITESEDSTYDLKKFEFRDPSLVEKHVTEAQNELAGSGVGICDDLITLEVMSPDVCDLTLIDLPGIARVPVKGQPQDIGDRIKDLIMKFIEKQETINLVVVPCNIDIATTEALKMAQEVDPKGRRTVAILTKPDLIDKGTEEDILKIVHNKVIPLRKGYTMVKCRGQRQIDENIPLEEATQMERDFFQNHDYFRDLLHEDKATIKCLAVKLTQNLVDHIKKSLPKLNQRIEERLWDVKNELKDYETGPPEDLEAAKQFLVEILKRFGEQIDSLSSGEDMSKENLFVQLRAQFKKWNDHLNSTKTTFSNSKELSQTKRGRQLLGFSNYKLFESLLQKHVANLKKPAVELLSAIKDIIITHLTDVVSQCFRNYSVLQKIAKDKIHNIQLTQQKKTEQRISEQFEMENVVYTQDPTYLKFLNEITNEKFSEDQLPGFDKKCKYSKMLEAYYEIVVQRMADQLPMMILFFMLKQTAQHLSTDMLTLLDGANVRELLSEETDVSRKRKELRERRDRLSAAQGVLNTFSIN
ncbi:interferon-induced GTP-binding protein Mx3-like [Pimephales promelas]|uniref:interferon-induced GTP-binding protein Mx3-like n=1 Tax=Pimephales promelas TaxID=90988 RepID=UPI0019554AF1|nr:interferon-induced GTP-binding protein Mx3-like [Pimephales promelas]